jgi:hypothetical protein
VAFPTEGILDTFTRADANPLDGNWANGATGNTDTAKIVTNKVASNGGFPDYRYTIDATGTGIDESYVTYDTLSLSGNSLYLFARLTSPGSSYNCYLLTVTNPDNGFLTLQITRQTNGANAATIWTNTASTDAFAAGDKVGLSCSGTSIQCYVYHSGAWALASNGGGGTDATYATGGKIGWVLSDTTMRISNFGGGPVGAAASAATGGLKLHERVLGRGIGRGVWRV